MCMRPRWQKGQRCAIFVLHGRRRSGGSLGLREQLVRTLQSLSLSRCKQAVATDVVQALGQHVLQQAMQEDECRQRLVDGLAGAAAAEAKG